MEHLKVVLENANPSCDCVFRAENIDGSILVFVYESKDSTFHAIIINYEDADKFFTVYDLKTKYELIGYLTSPEMQVLVDVVYKWDEDILDDVPDMYIGILEDDEDEDLEEYDNEGEANNQPSLD